MNVPIVSSAGTSYVLSQPTMSPHSHMAPPESPATSTPTAQQMTISTPPHVASPHMASSPVPSGATSIQFSQGTVMSQSPTVIQTMAQGGTTLQFPSQMPVLQQGTLSPAGYLQPLYQTTPTGQQQMLLSPASSLALQQQLGQGQITVMAGPQTQNAPQKITQDSQGKTVLTSVAAGQPNKGGQVITTQAGTVSAVGGKMTMASNIMANIGGPHKGSPQPTGQIVTQQAQFVTQTGGNGQTLLISPLGMLGTQGGMVGSMGGMLQAAHSPQGQVGKAGQGQQTQVTHKFLPAGQQKGAHNPAPLQLTGLPPGTQYRHLSPAGQQQLIAGQVGVGQVGAVGQPVLGQAQTILGSLQTFNAFGSGLPWASGQLSGQPLLQSPILIRNQHDGSVYIQSAPAAPHAQQQHQLHPTAATTTVQVQPQQQLQNATGQLGGHPGVSTVQQMQAGVTGVLPGTIMHAGTVSTLMQAQQPPSAQQTPQQTQSAQQTPTLGQTPPPGQPSGPQQITQHATVATGAGPPPAASPSQPQQHGAFHPMQHLSVQANGQIVTAVQSPIQAAVAPRVQRPITPQQPAAAVGVKVSAGSRGVRGIAARPAAATGSAGTPNTATPPNSQPPTPGASVTPTPSPDAENIKSMPVAQPASMMEDKKQDIIIMDTSSAAKTAAACADVKPTITAVNIHESQIGGPLIGTTVGVASSVGKDTGANSSLPPATAVQNLELVQQPITTVPVVTLPDVLDLPEGSSASPAIGAPFPEDAGNVPDTIEQASEILTHIIEGYVIRESSEPFPVSRSALLSEMIRREQVCAGSKERKRKLENNNNANKTVTATTAAAATTITTTATTTAGTATATNTSAAGAISSTSYAISSGTAAAAAAANLGLGIDQLGLDNGSKSGATELAKDTKEKDTETVVNPAVPAESVSENRRTESVSSVAVGLAQPEVVGAPGAGDASTGGGVNRNPSEWNVQDVYEFIKSVPGCAAYAEEFRVQEIDGEALIFLSTERHLMSQMNMKVGPAAKIYARLAQLRNDYNM